MTTGRSRFQVIGTASVGQGISIGWTALQHCTLIFFSITYSALPDPSDELTVLKASGTDPFISPVFRNIKIGAEAVPNAVCNEHFELLKGDRLIVLADNDADRNVGFEAILREGT